MSRDKLLTGIITILVLVIFLSFITCINRREKKTKQVVSSSSVSFSSSSVSVSEEKPFGKAINVKGKKAILIRKNLKEVISDKKLIYPGTTLIVENTEVVVSNRDSTILIDPGTKVYIGSNSLVQTSGETEIEGKINITVLGYKIYGEGKVIIKMKENEVQIAQYRGKTKIRKNTNAIELEEGKGIILYKDNIEQPFDLPEAPQEIKVRVY